ncbi:MAG: ribonuclease P protein component [Candidatus Pacebacteria bacterium]|nr:ribonuclease P protein component [Candidatus Paceibacterota bacterium]MDD5555145.1 ribonuclease P protein component [Candidatus Paceibacterota bacterium]
MLPKINRLRKKKDLGRVFKKGKNVRSPVLYFKILKTKEPSSRIGFIVSKKISLKAVERNKIRRRLRESVRAALSTLKESWDIVIIASPRIKKSSFEEIRKETEETFKNINNV